MINSLSNLGLDFLLEKEESATWMLSTIVAEGHTVQGYYSNPYINKTFGDAEFVVRTFVNKVSGSAEIEGLDIHASGRCIWDVAVRADITPDSAGKTEKRLIVSDPENSGPLAAVNILKADVVPTFAPGTILKMQVAGFPSFLEVYEDDEDFEKNALMSNPEEKTRLKDGAIFPTICSRKVRSGSGAFKVRDIDEYNLVRGRIIRLRSGRFKIGDETVNPFAFITISTCLGELDLAVSADKLDEIGREKIHTGATVVAGTVLSGDVAIFDYEKGVRRNARHDLLAVGWALISGNAHRLESILARDCSYYSVPGGWDRTGADQVISLINTLAKRLSTKPETRLAVVEDLLDPPDGAERIDQSCLVIRYPDGEETLVFLDYNGQRQIRRIYLDHGWRYEIEDV